MISQQIGKAIDDKLLDFVTIPTAGEGEFITTDQQLQELLDNYPARVYFRYKTDFVNGQIELQNGTKQYIPLGIVPNYYSEQFHSIKPVPQFTGITHNNELIFVEPVFDVDNNELIANFFGVQSGYSYKSIVIADVINKLHAFNYDGRYVYQLIDAGYANTYNINTVFDTMSNTHLIIYDLLEDTQQVFDVQYQPLYCDGIIKLGGLLLIKDVHGTVVCEYVDQSSTKNEDSITLHFPFTHYTVTDYQLPGETLTNSLDDSPTVDTSIRIIGGFHNRLMQSSKLDQFDQYQLVNQQIVYNSVNLEPTYIDSIQYLSSLDRQTYEPLQHLYARVQLQPQNEPIGKLYPIAVDPVNYTIIDNSLLLTVLDQLDNPIDYLLIMPHDYKTALTQIVDYTKLFTSLDQLKSEVSDITGIDVNQLEQQPNSIKDKMYTYGVRLVDGVRPVQVKFYKPDVRLSTTLNLTRVNGMIWNQQITELVNLVDLFPDQQQQIQDGYIYIQLSEIPAVHQVEKQDVPYRDLQAGRIIGVIDGDKIKYSF